MSITDVQTSEPYYDAAPTPLLFGPHGEDHRGLTIHVHDQRMGREQIVAEALRVVGHLTQRGVRSGDRVLLKAQNSPEYLLSLLALMQLDCSIVLLDDGLTGQEVRRAAEITKGRWILADYQPELGISIGVVTLDEQRDHDSSVVGDIDISTWLEREDAVISWSSGTTGEPKAIVRSGAAVRDILQRTQARMGYRADDVLLPLVPFSHFYGLTLVLLWWSVGCGVVVAARAELGRSLRLGCKVGVTVVDGTPSTYFTILRLLDRRPQMRGQLSAVRMWCVGGAPLPSSLEEAYRERLGSPLLNGYGSSEAGNVALAGPDDSLGCGTPLDGVEVRILDEDGGEVSDGAVGHIEVRSESLMQGYLGPDGILEPLDRTAWFRTGDLGSWLPGGQLAVVGREMAVHRMGHTLYPDIIERKAEACGLPIKVVALEDERRGSALVFVIESQHTRATTEWRRDFQRILPAYEQPNAVLVVPHLPLLSNGKVDVLRLREMAAQVLPSWNERLVTRQPTDADRLLAERSVALQRVADYLEDNREAVLEILTEVALHSSVEEEVEASIATLRGARDEVEEHRPKVVDQIAVFMPSNVLLFGYVLNLLVPSLYSREVSFRPSGQVADQTVRLHELLAPVHGLPIEHSPLSQRRFLNGPVARADVVVFTGTYRNAEDVRASLEPHQLFLFFGQGVNPFILADNADLELAARDAVRIRLLNSGQDCFGPDVFLVPDDKVDHFVTRLVTFVSELRFGPNHDPSADYGPMVYESAIEAAASYLQGSADRIAHGGRIDFAERRVEPTIVVRGSDEKLEIEEVFSPIFNVAGYRDEDHLRQILTSAYFADRSMGAMIYGDHPRLATMLATRHLVTNNQTLLEIDSGNEPFGGSGIMANYAAVGKKCVAEPILISKAVADHLEWRG